MLKYRVTITWHGKIGNAAHKLHAWKKTYEAASPADAVHQAVAECYATDTLTGNVTMTVKISLAM